MPTLEVGTRVVSDWKQLERILLAQQRSWIYRGQPENRELKTSLERRLTNWGIPLEEAPDVEHQLVRHFRRRLADARLHDTLYCLALMQHHGAPTRLLDFTYSPFAAASFALRDGPFTDDGDPRSPVLWCFNAEWLNSATRKVVGDRCVDERGKDEKRDDTTFRKMYQRGRDHPRFVLNENPLLLNERLTIQQGVFLCPGDVSVSFMENLRAMEGFELGKNVMCLMLKFSASEARRITETLKRMNLSSAALFPGFDGFARSLGEDLLHYRDLAKQGAGN